MTAVLTRDVPTLWPMLNGEPMFVEGQLPRFLVAARWAMPPGWLLFADAIRWEPDATEEP